MKLNVYIGALSACMIMQVRAESFALGVENIPHNFFPKMEAQLGHRPRVGLITNQPSKTLIPDIL